MNVADFDYTLPPELIAQKPVPERDTSRLMLLDKHTGGIGHTVFRDIVNFLNPADCLVLNNTGVLPARLHGEQDGKPVEILLLNNYNSEGELWEALVKPGKRARTGSELRFGGERLTALVEGIGEEGTRLLRMQFDGSFDDVLEELGETPLPPYITERLDDKNRYQTVYAKQNTSAAAPTAGLHFTENLLRDIRECGVTIAEITLQVGLGTFRPVRSELVEEHKMHSERFYIAPEQADKINAARKRGGRVIAVGTTVCRTLESRTRDGVLQHGGGFTDIFIYPGYKFQLTDALITNFHLPKSTLIMLVSAFAGRGNTLHAYNTAVAERYRFFSFGDAMFIN